MKRHFFFFVIVFMGINAMAQNNLSEKDFGNKPIDIKGSRVFVEDFKLDKYSAASCFSSLNGIDKSSDYLKNRAGYKTGLGLTIGGASLAFAGSVTTLFGFIAGVSKGLVGHETLGADIAIGVGICSVFAGSACFVAGIPTVCVYKKRLNRLEKEYNTSLQLGTSSNGLSMALCF